MTMLHENDLQRLRFAWHMIQLVQPEFEQGHPASVKLREAKAQIDQVIKRGGGEPKEFAPVEVNPAVYG